MPRFRDNNTLWLAVVAALVAAAAIIYLWGESRYLDGKRAEFDAIHAALDKGAVRLGKHSIPRLYESKPRNQGMCSICHKPKTINYVPIQVCGNLIKVVKWQQKQ